MVRDAQYVYKELVKEGYPGFIKRMVEDKNDRCENWRDRFDKEFKVNSMSLRLESES